MTSNGNQISFPDRGCTRRSARPGSSAGQPLAGLRLTPPTGRDPVIPAPMTPSSVSVGLSIAERAQGWLRE